MADAILVEPSAAHRLDAGRLREYLKHHMEGIEEALTVRQFQGGQSNPTYLLESAGLKWVLRKKPPGKLLRSAHQIDREYRIQTALRQTGVPVAPMLHYCNDPEIIGTEFYVMPFLAGRVFNDVLMGDLPPAERTQLQTDLFQTIGRLHKLDYLALGLQDFGRPANFLARQLERWRGQYEASKAETLPEMDKLMDWLGENLPQDEECAIAHGDFRLGNMMVSEQAPNIIAVLDWELATLGHPLADLAYCCLPFHFPHLPGLPLSGYGDTNLAAHGLLTEESVLAIYCQQTGRAEIPNWKFFLGFAMFRAAAIAEGVYARALAGNAADTAGIRMNEVTQVAAKRGWQIVKTT